MGQCSKSSCNSGWVCRVPLPNARMCHPGSGRANRRAKAAAEQSSAVKLNCMILTLIRFFPAWCRAGISELRKGNNFINKQYLRKKKKEGGGASILLFSLIGLITFSEHWELFSRFPHKYKISAKIWKGCWKFHRIPYVDFTAPLQYLQQSHCLLTARRSICNFSGSFEVWFLGNHILSQTVIKQSLLVTICLTVTHKYQPVLKN